MHKVLRPYVEVGYIAMMASWGGHSVTGGSGSTARAQKGLEILAWSTCSPYEVSDQS